MKWPISWLLLVLALCPGNRAYAADLWVEKDKHHTSVIIARGDLERLAPALSSLGTEGDYLRFGWGDRTYYGASERHTGDLLLALFVPSDSVLEVTALNRPAQGMALRRLTVDETGLQQILSRIEGTLHNGVARLDRREPGGRYYYRAEPRYHLLANCNHWTAQLLAEAGIPLRYLPSTFSGALWRRLDKALAARYATPAVTQAAARTRLPHEGGAHTRAGKPAFTAAGAP